MRRSRRDNAQDGGKLDDVPSTQPPLSASRRKTLLDVAEEKETELHSRHENQRLATLETNTEAALNAVLYGMTLTSVNL